MPKTERDRVQAVLDRFQTAVENDRCQGRFVDDLSEEPFTLIEEWASSLTEIAEAVDRAREAVEEWREFEGDRDDKAAAKEEALSALGELCEVWDASPLDVASLTAWDPEEAE